MYDSLITWAKDSPQILKRIFNILLVGSITSFLFVRAYFEYDIIDASNYQGLYQFFINGEFIVPFALFFIIWYLTQGIGGLIFNKLTTSFEGNMFGFLTDRIKKPTNQKVLRKLKRRSLSFQQSITSDFTMFFRTQIALILYCINVPHFSLLLCTVSEVFIVLRIIIYLINL